MRIDDALGVVLNGDPDAVRGINGFFALVAREGKRVRLARSLDRPIRYFLAKLAEGRALVVAERIETIREWLNSEGFQDQFHPSYTRMVPAYYVVAIQLLDCPDPQPVYTRSFNPEPGILPPELDTIGRTYLQSVAKEIQQWFL